MKENIIKTVLVFGGAFLIFSLFKPKKDAIIKNSSTGGTKNGSDGSVSQPIDMNNAKIVADAYAAALKAGESAQNLTELNKELMKEFGMRCYVSSSNQLIVCDSKGTTIMTK